MKFDKTNNANASADVTKSSGGNHPSKRKYNRSYDVDDRAKKYPKCTNQVYQDWQWYAKNNKIAADMASFPFLNVVGDVIGNSSDVVSGIMIIKHRHCITTSGAANSGNYATRAAHAFYNYVVQGYTGGVDFEASDLMMVALAANSLYALMIEGKRAYSALNYYLQFNRYYASVIVKALGFNFDDMVGHKADFRARYNILVDQVNKLCAVPKGFFIGDRWEYLAGSVFTDTDSAEYSTSFAYVCEAALKFNPTIANTGSCLEWVHTNSNGYYVSTGRTIDAYFAVLDELVNALQDTDVRSIFGAIRRVYSSSDLKTLTELESDIAYPLVRNDVASATIHNMSWIAGASGPSAYGNAIGYLPSNLAIDGVAIPTVPIYQDASDNIIGDVYVKYDTGDNWIPYMGGSYSDDVVLDMYDHMVSPENILDLTSNIQVGTTSPKTVSVTVNSTTYRYAQITCRTELITNLYMWNYNNGNPNMSYVLKGYAGGFSVTLPIAQFTHVDSHPLLCCATVGTPTVANNPSIAYFLGELDRYTVVSRSDIMKLHDRSLFNLLLMPENTKSVTRK